MLSKRKRVTLLIIGLLLFTTGVVLLKVYKLENPGVDVIGITGLVLIAAAILTIERTKGEGS